MNVVAALVVAASLARPTSVPTVAPADALCGDAVLHGYAAQAEAVVAHLDGRTADRLAIDARLDALARRLDACVRAALTRLGSSLDETDSRLAFAAIERRMRLRLVCARVDLAFDDRARARTELRDLDAAIASMSDYTREHEPDAYPRRRALYDGFVRAARDLERRAAASPLAR